MNRFVKIPASKNSLANRKLVCGVGVNDSWYVIETVVDGKRARCLSYQKWRSMLQRCYSKGFQERHSTYKDCTVCDEWLTFSVFAGWLEENAVEGCAIDKDIIKKDNKLYSPETCLMVPQCINNLILDSSVSRGIYPVGVDLHKQSGKYRAKLSIDSKVTYLGLYATPELASKSYVKAKNNEIKRKCEQYPEFAGHLINHLVS